MPIPTPEPGLVISYAYLWDHEAQSGQEEGRKDRPCVIAIAVERQPDRETLVTVLFKDVLAAFLAWHKAHGVALTPR
jgi:hypothetical protein